MKNRIIAAAATPGMSGQATRMGDMGNEYVGQQARVIIPLHRSVDVSDAVTAEMRSTAHEALAHMMAEHGCTPADLSLLWVKPLDHVEPELLGTLAKANVGDIDFWMYEATAA